MLQAPILSSTLPTCEYSLAQSSPHTARLFRRRENRQSACATGRNNLPRLRRSDRSEMKNCLRLDMTVGGRGAVKGKYLPQPAKRAFARRRDDYRTTAGNRRAPGTCRRTTTVHRRATPTVAAASLATAVQRADSEKKGVR